MPYIYKYNKELEQFGLCSYRLNITDSDLILPEMNIPVIFRKGEDIEETMQKIALRMIEENTPLPEPVVEEQPVSEEQPVVEEQAVSEEQPVVEEQAVSEEQPV